MTIEFFRRVTQRDAILFPHFMPYPSRYAAILIAATVVFGTTSCADNTAPGDDPATLAGTYVLETSSGRYAPISGSIVLTQAARAERRVRYDRGSAGISDYVTIGTFALAGDGTIVFSLNESCGSATCVWNVRASRAADSFTLEYPDPADGPTIRETYSRQ